MPLSVGIIADSYNKPSASFTPLMIPWHTAFWADDPAWGHPADGVTVQTWPDATGNGRNASTVNPGTYQPIWRASIAALNNQAALDFTTNFKSLLTTAWTAVAQPWSVVVIIHIRNATNSLQFLDGKSISNRAILGINASTKWFFNCGNVDLVSSVTADTVAHLFTIVGNDVSSVLEVDGTSVSGNAGSNANTGLSLNSNYADSGGYLNQEMAFVGFYAGDVRGHANWAAFKTGAKTKWGLP
jgi:hypothetical protein